MKIVKMGIPPRFPRPTPDPHPTRRRGIGDVNGYYQPGTSDVSFRKLRDVFGSNTVKIEK